MSWAVPSSYQTEPVGGHWYPGDGESDTGKPEVSCRVPHALFPRLSLQHRGDLGNVRADEDGRAVFRIEDEQLKVRWRRRQGPFLTDPMSEAVVSPQRCGM